MDFFTKSSFFYEIPIGFFDGASVNDICGASIFIKMNDHHVYKAYFTGGKGNNMKDELLGLWGLLFLAQKLSLSKWMEAGDSKVTIDWINGINNLNMLYLQSWKEKIKRLKASFDGIMFIHIHKEFNSLTNSPRKLWTTHWVGFILNNSTKRKS